MDSDLRSALQRRYGSVPVLPEDFAEKVLSKMDAGSELPAERICDRPAVGPDVPAEKTSGSGFARPAGACSRRRWWRKAVVGGLAAALLVGALLLDRKPAEERLAGMTETSPVEAAFPTVGADLPPDSAAATAPVSAPGPERRARKRKPRVRNVARQEPVQAEAADVAPEAWQADVEEMLQARFEAGEHETGLIREGLTMK